MKENRDIQVVDRKEISADNPRGGKFVKKKNNAGLQNMELYRSLRHALPRRHDHRLSDYLIDVLAESINPECWRRILGEARHRISLYYPEE
jgi:hypothetical protein